MHGTGVAGGHQRRDAGVVRVDRGLRGGGRHRGRVRAQCEAVLRGGPGGCTGKAREGRCGVKLRGGHGEVEGAVGGGLGGGGRGRGAGGGAVAAAVGLLVAMIRGCVAAGRAHEVRGADELVCV